MKLSIWLDFSHIVLAVDDGDIIGVFIAVQGFEISLKFIAIQGHEIVVELINGDTDFMSLSSGRDYAGQYEDHSQNKKHRFFHFYS